jgi:superfamily II DNA/RNA helicase
MLWNSFFVGLQSVCGVVGISLWGVQAQEPRLSRAEGTFALVLVPTRELALQVADLMGVLLRRFPYLVGGAIYGGENRSKEKVRASSPRLFFTHSIVYQW